MLQFLKIILKTVWAGLGMDKREMAFPQHSFELFHLLQGLLLFKIKILIKFNRLNMNKKL